MIKLADNTIHYLHPKLVLTLQKAVAKGKMDAETPYSSMLDSF